MVLKKKQTNKLVNVWIERQGLVGLRYAVIVLSLDYIIGLIVQPPTRLHSWIIKKKVVEFFILFIYLFIYLFSYLFFLFLNFIAFFFRVFFLVSSLTGADNGVLLKKQKKKG